jgi:hypothetical protein
MVSGLALQHGSSITVPVPWICGSPKPDVISTRQRDMPRVVEAIRALPVPPSIIGIDTLHRFLAGDENSAQDAKTMLDACAALMREFNCSIVLVHHTGVSDEAQHRARGSSAWKGALEIEISVVPAKGDATYSDSAAQI